MKSATIRNLHRISLQVTFQLCLAWLLPWPGMAAPAPVELPTRVTMRADLAFLVNGRPFFPIGLYYVPEEIADPSGNGLADLREMGFNYIFYNGTDPGEMARLARSGLLVHYRPAGSLNAGLDRLPAIVESVRSHLPLFCWEIEDEPTLNKVDFDRTRAGCARLKQLDPDHPILVTHDTYISRAELRRWGGICDINGFDFYPVPLTHWWYGSLGLPVIRSSGYHTIGVMGQLTAAWGRSVPGKPVLPVLQAFSWDPGKYGEHGYPTPAQLRFMAYQVVIAGARGISFYGRVRTAAPSSAGLLAPNGLDPRKGERQLERARRLNGEFWTRVRPVIRELADMAPVFAALDAGWKPAVIRRFDTPDMPGLLESRLKQLPNGGWVLLLVNDSPAPCGARIRLPRTKAGGGVCRWMPDGTLLLKDRREFTDSLEPFGVRIYASRSQREMLQDLR